jgi:sugar/nucleoside kinase (ribokinase family)
MSLLIVGSIGIDDIKTPHVEKKNLLGGSASYASVSASQYNPVRLVGIVGTDFPEVHMNIFKSRSMDLAGLTIAEGKTFYWSGEYEENMNNRQTLEIGLNVFETFSPILPDSYKDTPFIFLANGSPDLQSTVLDQIQTPQFVIVDTMDLWIQIAQPKLLELLQRVDMLILNDSEAKMLSGEDNLIKAAKTLLKKGPKYVVVKKGEHGSMILHGDEIFVLPAFPLENVNDPTGAGDTFAGALAGYLADKKEVSFEVLKHALVEATIMASFTCEDFSLNKLLNFTETEKNARREKLLKLVKI